MQEHIDIFTLSGYQTPAKARYFMEYDGKNIDELRDAVVSTTAQGLPILTIAGGRNSLLAFDEYPGLVIHNSSKNYVIEKNNEPCPLDKAEAETNKKTSNRVPLSRGMVDPFSVVDESQDELLRRTKDQGVQWIKEDSFIGDNLNPPALQASPLDRGATGTILRADSGYPIWQLAEELETDHGIDFWHRFQWLPGSIGGAVFGNAGCFGLEIGAYVTSIDILDMQTGETFTKTGEELNFAYRWSECKNHPFWFILSVTCDLSQMIEKYPAPEENPLAWRARVQPQGFSCGSFFKNPSREHSAGSLLEQSGLKWHHLWGAYFSDKHANFLMSDGTATWQDLVQLIEFAQKEVKEKTGFDLEPEVRIIRA